MPRRSLIQEEIKQGTPFPTKSAEAWLTLLRTVTILRRPVEAVAQSEGLSLQQYNVLRILRGARGPLPTMEIADRLIEPSPGITRMVNNLEEKGLLRREQWPGDRRQVLCQITPAGLRILEKLQEPMDRLDDETLGRLPEDRLETLIEILDEIRLSLKPDT